MRSGKNSAQLCCAVTNPTPCCHHPHAAPAASEMSRGFPLAPFQEEASVVGLWGISVVTSGLTSGVTLGTLALHS